MTTSGLSENWATLWEALATGQPDRVAIVIGDSQIRWGDFDHGAARAAAALHERGIGLDDKVAQLLYNCPEYLETTYASFKLRAATVNVNYRYKAPEIVHVLSDSGAKALVFHGAFAAAVDEARRSLPDLELLVQVDGGDGVPVLPGAIGYDELLEGVQPMPPIQRAGSDTQLLYTGGTTGLPKGVVWTHAGLFGALAFTGYGSMGVPVPTTAQDVGRVAVELSAAGRSPVNMTAPPLMHGTGLFLAFSTFVLGGRVVLLAGRRFDAVELLNLVQRERVTQLSMVGDAFARPIVTELERAVGSGHPYDLSTLSRIVSTGATTSAEMKRGMLRAAPNATIIDMIGASEGGPFAVSVTQPGQEPLETAKFMATPATVVFDDLTWEPIPWGTGRAGVLAASGPGPESYWRKPEATAKVFRVIDGVRYSMPGDYATIDADGQVHLLGRGSVCINTGGEKVYPEEVEVAARSHPGIVDSVAVGVPDERFGERIVLVASRQPGSDVTGPDVIAHVKERIADYKAPREVCFVEEVYRSPSGKADYRWARDAASRQ
jgi:3-oxocholest-4-en-26-oate---CoA ligase